MDDDLFDDDDVDDVSDLDDLGLGDDELDDDLFDDTTFSDERDLPADVWTDDAPVPTAAADAIPDADAAASPPGVWADLVGQEHAVATLRRAVAAADAVLAHETESAGLEHAMTHAWLITGPPGSGRSNAARAFAAALECPHGGCGECNACVTSLSGAHPDVTLVRTEQLSIGVDEVRSLAMKSALRPAMRRWQVIVVEDADRVTDKGANALLKSMEEPPERTVWVLCAPSAEDVIVTIRSRAREVRLVTPNDDAVAALLVRRDGVDLITARRAARAAQGHIGRARALATDAGARQRRDDILALPGSLTSLRACLSAAARLISSAQDDAEAVTADLDARERTTLNEALGIGAGFKPRNAQAALNDLDDQQKARAKRLQRDSLDRAISELTAWYRDVLAVQLQAVPADGGAAPHEPELINPEQAAHVTAAARTLTPEQTLRRIDALLLARRRIETNVTPLLAMESLMISLGHF
jgi:DNA polymerase-3 subunit delta'